MKTFSAKPLLVSRKWILIDASRMVLGRLAARVACLLRGKHKAEYTPHVDTGDYVIIVNADKLVVTGKKTQDKIYYRHTGFPGGLYERSFEEFLRKDPRSLFETAVKGMLPKGPLGSQMLKKLKVYKNEQHPHVAQQPVSIELNI